ncbi:MAG: YceI family protein [Rhodobacteraceae bacterium]|nr:YceI family protein [Paracoccaceae bacterium]
MPDGADWQLVPEASSLSFQSIKNQSIIESSKFKVVSGAITPAGLATIRINLDSVDTNVDLRDVRMRFLLFETFQYPEAIITAGIDLTSVQDIAVVRRKTISLPYSLNLHGNTKAAAADVVVTMLSDDMISVSAAAPIVVATNDFDMSDGIKKLEEAAGVSIVPSASISFDFVFRQINARGPGTNLKKRDDDGPASVAEEKQPQASAQPKQATTAKPAAQPKAEPATQAPQPAAPSSNASASRSSMTLRCKMARYGSVPAGSVIKRLVPPSLTISINGSRASISGVTQSAQVSDTGDRVKIRYVGSLGDIGPTNVFMTFIPKTGFLSVNTRAQRSIPWEEDFPERAGKFVISGSCSRG